MKLSPYFLSLAACWLLICPELSAQVPDSTDRLFFESYSFGTEGRLDAATAFTEPVYGYGNITRLLYRIPASRRMSVNLGAGLGVRRISQKSTLDLRECELGPVSRDCSVFENAYVRANHASFFFEIPVQFRYLLGREGRGVYLTAGSAVQLPFFNTMENYSVGANRSEAVIPEDELTAKVSHHLSTGLGYQIRETNKYLWYLEFTYSWSTDTVVENTVGTRRDNLQLNYFQTTRVRQLGLTGGLNF